MTPIRALSIRPGEKYTRGRVPFHLAEATLTALPKPPARRPFFTRGMVAFIFALPSLAALAIVAAWLLLRRGMLL